MGRLYRARDIRSGQAVAIKTLELARDFSGARLDDARQRFRREAEAAWRLSHPDIVQVLDAGEDQGLAYIAMELLSGHDLTHHILPEQRLGVPQVLAIGRRVAGALAHAHRQGVIHRDIKPANIMIDLPQGQIKVTDFGIARLSNTARTRTGLVLGSPLYMSPEQISGQQVDERTDLYSLGLVLHQLLSGRPPVEAASLGELMRAVVERPIPGLHQVRPDLPQDLVDVIELCLQKQAELRTRSAQDLATDLELVIDRHGLECEFGVASTAASPTNPAPTGITPAGNGETFMHNRPV
ncbi:MAG: hypothetical protein RL722_872 [Pseudomonadota bacterium]